jgi:hypothetical protein
MLRIFLICLAVLLIVGSCMAHEIASVDSVQLTATAHIVDWQTCAQQYAHDVRQMLDACGDPPSVPCYSQAGYGDTSC